jgi:hypothetical protein
MTLTALDDDVVRDRSESRVADERSQKPVLSFVAVKFVEHDDTLRLQRADEAVHRVDGHRRFGLSLRLSRRDNDGRDYESRRNTRGTSDQLLTFPVALDLVPAFDL